MYIHTRCIVHPHPAKEPSLFGADPVNSTAVRRGGDSDALFRNRLACFSLCNNSFIVSPSIISLRMWSTELPLEASRMFAHVESSALVAMALIVAESVTKDVCIQCCCSRSYSYFKSHAYEHNSRCSSFVTIATSLAHRAGSGVRVSA